MSACMVECAEAETSMIDCWKSASCEDVSYCGGALDGVRHCDIACARLVECGVLQQEQCSCLGFQAEVMTCLAEANCEEVPGCLGETDEESSRCETVCSKLIDCGHVVQADRAGCERECRFDLALADRQCIVDSACEVFAARCLSNFPNPNCADACRRLNRCEALGQVSRADCGLRCADENWTAEARLCVYRTLCAQLPGDCEVLP